MNTVTIPNCLFLLLLFCAICVNAVPLLDKNIKCLPCTCKYHNKCLPCTCKYHNNSDNHSEYIEMNCANLHLPSLTNITPPDEAKNLSMRIYFDNNTISTITSYMLSNLTVTGFNISSLSFRNNTLKNISRDAFDAFHDVKSLQELDLSVNRDINKESLKESFDSISKTNIKILNISAMEIRNISQDFFENLTNIQNLTLIFHNNTINVFPVEALMSLEHLENLDFGSNGLTDLQIQNATFPSLIIFTLDNNFFFDFPDFCYGEENSTRFPKLQNLSIQWNEIRYLHKFHYSCLTELTHFFLNGNQFVELQTNQFALLPHLYKITLSYVGCAIKRVAPAVFNNSGLRQIYFRENHLWFRETEVSLRIFDGCTGLDLLNLSDNFFQKTTEEEFNGYLSSLTSLKFLIMGGCVLSHIPSVITEKLVHIETLALYRNSITDLGENTFDKMTNLSKLFMGNNKITAITRESLPQRFFENAADVEFINNPFSCTCDLMWFIKWMKTKPNVFKINSDKNASYTCSSPDHLKGDGLLDLDMSEASCLLDQGEKILTLTSSIILIVFLIVGSGLYRYRWHIRYFIYMVRYSQRQELDTGPYDYDAFVAYSSEDRHWIIKTLLPVIENKENLKLCVHDRDFEVGNLIVDNIVDGIEKSRKVIIVLSNNFAKSDWCQFELNLIQRHVLENGQRLLVLVMLEEIETRHVTKAMRAMLQTTTYLLWGEEDYARKAFFNRLRMLLKRPTRKGRERRLSV